MKLMTWRYILSPTSDGQQHFYSLDSIDVAGDSDKPNESGPSRKIGFDAVFNTEASQAQQLRMTTLSDGNDSCAIFLNGYRLTTELPMSPDIDRSTASNQRESMGIPLSASNMSEGGSSRYLTYSRPPPYAE